MTEITPFTFPTTGQTVRTVVIDGEPWFVASDVADALGYYDGRKAIGTLPERMRGSVSFGNGTPGNPNRTVINEPGVYRLAMRSSLATAEAFQDWLAEDVVPSIRKTGSYSLPSFEIPSSFAEALELAARQQRELEAAKTRAAAAEHQVLELAPSARMHDELMGAAGDYSVREAALILDRDSRISTGQKRLFVYLREIGWIGAHNLPYQRHVDCGRLALRVSSYEHPHRDEQVATQQVRISVKGLSELHRMLGGGSQFQALMSEEVSAA